MNDHTTAPGQSAELKGSASPAAPSLSQALLELVSRIVAVAQPEQIILFGSAARGAVYEDSDLDILVIKSGANRRELAGRIYRQLLGFGRPVDIVVATPEDIERYRHSPALVLAPALKEGVLIYAR